MQYLVISRNGQTGKVETIIDKMRGDPLTYEQACRFRDRMCAAEDRGWITYEVEATLSVE